MDKLKSFLKGKHQRHWLAIVAALALSVASVNLQYESLLMTSVTSTPQYTFTGTTMPIQEIPNWSEIPGEYYYDAYKDIPRQYFIDIPTYDNDSFTFPSKDLVWGNSSHKVIRNAKITYPVPYGGNYELDDCGEWCGSHPAVDIKVPEGTPVHAVANGKVIESRGSGTWGEYIVIEHRGVPAPGGASTTTLYSSYSHMGDRFVHVGDIVEVGEIIGEVSDTGTATTDHLHFQIDNSSAPWHPYWPFSSSEASKQGYSFWEAVSAGVGADNVKKYTINPIDWIYENLDGSAVIQTVAPEPEPEPEPVVEEEKDEAVQVEPASEETVTDVAVEDEQNIGSSIVSIAFNTIEADTPDFIISGQQRYFDVRLYMDGNWLKDPDFDGSISVSVSDEDVATLNHTSITPGSFDDGEAQLALYAHREGEVYLTFEINGQYSTSELVYVIDDIQPATQFGVVVKENRFVPYSDTKVQIQALDYDGNPTPDFDGSGSIELKIIEGSGSLSKTTLTKKDFNSGIASVTLSADDDEPIVIQATYGTKVFESKRLRANIFSDMSSSDEHWEAVYALYKEGVISGYPDGTFRPTQHVNRVEALKFIYVGTGRSIYDGVTVSFPDTSMSEWYGNILATAYEDKVVQGYPNGTFGPTNGVNRVEFLKMLFSVVDAVDVDPVVLEGEVPKDVNNLSWFAPYVKAAVDYNILPAQNDGKFYPETVMSREEVAETIYRLLVVMKHDAPYSALYSL